MGITEKTVFLNNVGVDYNVFYSKKHRCFVLRDPRKISQNSKTYIEMPYRENCQRLAWPFFWSMLNEEEKALADAFDGDGGFFDYMRETGLISVYDEALELATTKVFDRWECENGLRIDWEKAYIDG